jgi:DNA-binding transcriptional MerR regulator
VLSPSGRSSAGYRRYSAADDARLARIRRYRRAGLPLAVIRGLLDSPDADLTTALGIRLEELNREVHHLREQQRFILAYLRGDRGVPDDLLAGALPFLTADRFVELLDLAGVRAEQRAMWHAAFEQASGSEHQAFLEFLCLSDEAIESIRRWARGGDTSTAPTP